MNIIIEPIYIGIIQTLISFIFISGFIFCGSIITSKIFKDYNNLLFNLLLSIVFFSQLLKIISILGFFKQANLIFSFFIFFVGIYNLKYFYALISKQNFLLPKNILEFSVIFLMLCFFIISIAPPSMADALDYHYGFPLYLLRFNEIPNPYLWINSTIAGNGEFINSLPIYLGTDNFGSLLQFFALVFFLLFLRGKIKNKKKLLFLYIFVLSSPTLLQLISGPKFLLFPQVLTAIALLLVLEKKKINNFDFIFIAILLMGASQFKLSFLLSGAIIGAYLFLKTFIYGKIKIQILTSSLILSAIFFAPTFLWNYSQLIDFNYQNIFSAVPIETIHILQNYRENFKYIYPFNLILPNEIGSISSILGFQFLVLFFIFKKKQKINHLVILTIASIFLHYFLSMNEARIYYEFILWSAVGIYFLSDESINYTFFSKILFIQLFAVLCMSFYFAAISLPSIFSNISRDKFMEKNSIEYDAFKWINKVLPDDAKIITELRSVSLYKNEFVPMDMLSGNISKFNLNEYLSIIKEKKIDYIVLRNNSKYITLLKDCVGDKYLQSPLLTKSTRNPLNRNHKYFISIYEFNSKDVLNCVK